MAQEEIHGFKLVCRDTYAPLWHFYRRDAPRQRYVPGTTQWITWDDASGRHPPPALKICTPSTLHFCRRATEAALFVNGADNMALIRVTPVRWPTMGTDAPLFVEETDATALPKCGAYGLRVDGEVTDAAERRALLSGEVERADQYCPGGKIVYTIDNGRIMNWRMFDLLGNCMSVSSAAEEYCYAYFPSGIAVAVGDTVPQSSTVLYEGVAKFVNDASAFGPHTTVAHVEKRDADVRILKCYTVAQLQELVAAAADLSDQ